MRPAIYQRDDERSYVINRTGLVPDFRGTMATPKAHGRRDGRPSATNLAAFRNLRQQRTTWCSATILGDGPQPNIVAHQIDWKLDILF